MQSKSFVLSAMRGDRGGQLTMLALLLAVILVPLGNILLPAGHPLHVETFTVSLLGKYLSYAMLALAVDLVWGYLGILSLGHGAFFALGGYVMGMYLMRQIGDRGVYGNPVLPDFMVFLNWQELPWFWQGVDQFWFACLMIVLVPGVLAFIFGYLALFALSIALSAYTTVCIRNHVFGQLCANHEQTPENQYQFNSSLTVFGYVWLVVSNFLLQVITLGIARPWVMVRTTRYLADNTEVIGDMTLLEAIDLDSDVKSAITDEVAQAFDIGIGIG